MEGESIVFTTYVDYLSLIGLDNSVYPTPSPVTFDSITKWYHKNPEFCFVIQKGGKDVGIVNAIPLNFNGWKGMQDGSVKECDVDFVHIFDLNRDTDLYLHLYHIERLDNEDKDIKIWEQSLIGLSQCIQHLNKASPHKIVCKGLSGYCTSSAGVGLFSKKFGCKERGFISTETIVKTPFGQISVHNISTPREFEDLKMKGFEIIQRCQLLSTLNTDESIVWKYLH
eukprot:TRINITY_DN7958_c0_g1_i1.p1 TRINITY_DN7958_c0_g1~~TRINITY_DN7958_c0_g1_i1.p1  ORF type:complete len:226 (+),score=25.49 TRINITY_DN7958_c0_g1_i1:95-772(+)